MIDKSFVAHYFNVFTNSKTTAKLTIPLLVLSGDIYPALGGDIPGNMTLNSIQALALATNVQSVIVPYSGHWIPEERPDFLLDQVSKFFGNSNNDSK